MIREVPAEVIFGETASATVMPFELDSNAMLQDAPSTDGTINYKLTLRQNPLRADEVLYLFRAAAPDCGRDEPPAVIQDWQEPDQTHRAGAASRMSNHARYLGEAWGQFMASRQYYIEVLDAVPKLTPVEKEVQLISDRSGLDGYCANLMVYKLIGSETKTARLWEQLDLPKAEKREAVAILCRSLGISTLGVMHLEIEKLARNRIKERFSFEELQAAMGELSDDFVRGVVQQSVRLMCQTPGWRFNPWRHRYARSPSSDLLTQYTAQMVKANIKGDEPAEIRVYRNTGTGGYTPSWIIPLGASFKEYISSDGAKSRALLVSQLPTAKDEGTTGSYIGNAVLHGSRVPNATAPQTEACIQWCTMPDGRREFTLGEQDQPGVTLGRRIVTSGLAGVLLAAVAQPHVRDLWRKRIALPYSSASQRIGVAQVPVLALSQAEQLLAGGLFDRVEHFAA